jgi:4'-phosphopantetheinyl transferase
MGCDLELVEPRSDAFIADYFASGEQSLVARVPEAARHKLLALLWSAKESALKALRTGLRLDTRSVIVSLPNSTLRDREELLAQDDDFASSAIFDNPWQALQVHAPGGQIFHGFWQASGQFVRTILASPTPSRPIAIDPSAYKKLLRKEANDEDRILTFA